MICIRRTTLHTDTQLSQKTESHHTQARSNPYRKMEKKEKQQLYFFQGFFTIISIKATHALELKRYNIKHPALLNVRNNYLRCKHRVQ